MKSLCSKCSKCSTTPYYHARGFWTLLSGMKLLQLPWPQCETPTPSAVLPCCGSPGYAGEAAKVPNSQPGGCANHQIINQWLQKKEETWWYMMGFNSIIEISMGFSQPKWWFSHPTLRKTVQEVPPGPTLLSKMVDFAVFPVKSWKAGGIFPATIHFVDTKKWTDRNNHWQLTGA